MSGLTTAESYPGNPSLPKEVREKILSTFRHTLNLYQGGQLEDCQIGCDFILKMDPRFAPAQRLLDKTRNPAADVDIEQLKSLVAEAPARKQIQAEDADRLVVRAMESYNARDFEAAIAAAEQVLAVLPLYQDALEILEKARSKKEVQPEVNSCRERVVAALESGREDEARSELEWMRQLDPEHPAIPLIERHLGKPKARSAEAADRPGSGRAVSEPPISFEGDDTSPFGQPSTPGEPAGPGGGLESLSLDALSLDQPPSQAQVALSPPDPQAPATAALPSPPSPGFPSDLWSEGEPEAEAQEPEIPVAPLEVPKRRSMETEIEALLQQGDSLARRGDRQQAIEVWSRIFLIDINHVGAVARIEKARQEMTEGNRRVAECLKEGRESYEIGDLAKAKEAFLEVLSIEENEPTARFYLQRIEEGPAPPAKAPDLSATAPKSDILSEELAEGIHETGASAEAAPSVRLSAVQLPARRMAIVLMGLFVLLLGLGGFLILRTPKPERAASTGPEGPSLARATAFFQDGKPGEAAAELERIPRSHPDYEKAQKLLVSLRRSAGAEPGAEAATAESASSSAPPSQDPAAWRAAAETALAEKRYIEAFMNFNLAAPAFPGDPVFGQQMAAASEKVSELTPAVKLYNEGEYETAIPIFWRIYQADRGNQDARSYLLRTYYNQGITQLQNGLFEKAKESFREALQIDPQDAEVLRHSRFAERYAKGDLDLLGRIYVRHLRQRP